MKEIEAETNHDIAALSKSIEYIAGGYTKGLDNFLTTSNDLKRIGIEDEDARVLKRGLYGGIPLAPLVAAGVPDCMLRYDRDQEMKYVISKVPVKYGTRLNILYKEYGSSLSQIIASPP